MSTFAARTSSTDHPRIFEVGALVALGIFVAIAIGFAADGQVGGGALMLLLGLAIAGVCAWPAYWSRRHPDQAHQQVVAQAKARDRMARRHPAYFLVFVPLLAGADGVLRFNRGHSHTVLADVLVAMAAVGVGAIVGGIVIRRARRRG